MERLSFGCHTFLRFPSRAAISLSTSSAFQYCHVEGRTRPVESISHGSCDVAVIPPTDDEVVIVGGRGVNGGPIGWDDRWTTWSCHPTGVGGVVGWLFLRPGIAKPRRGKSG